MSDKNQDFELPPVAIDPTRGVKRELGRSIDNPYKSYNHNINSMNNLSRDNSMTRNTSVKEIETKYNQTIDGRKMSNASSGELRNGNLSTTKSKRVALIDPPYKDEI